MKDSRSGCGDAMKSRRSRRSGCRSSLQPPARRARGDAVEQHLQIAELIGEQQHEARVEVCALALREPLVGRHPCLVERVGVGDAWLALHRGSSSASARRERSFDARRRRQLDRRGDVGIGTNEDERSGASRRDAAPARRRRVTACSVDRQAARKLGERRNVGFARAEPEAEEARAVGEQAHHARPWQGDVLQRARALPAPTATAGSRWPAPCGRCWRACARTGACARARRRRAACGARRRCAARGSARCGSSRAGSRPRRHGARRGSCRSALRRPRRARRARVSSRGCRRPGCRCCRRARRTGRRRARRRR